VVFRPIHIVWNQSILGNRDIENFVLEKQCSAQYGAKSVALSMPMMNTRLSAYICSHYSNGLGSTTLSKVIVNCIVSDTFIGFALVQVSLPHYSGRVAKSNEGMCILNSILSPN